MDLAFYEQFIAIEIERTPCRIANAIKKGRLAKASELWIVASNPSVRRAIKRRLIDLGQPTIPQKNAWICLSCLPQALDRLDTIYRLQKGGRVVDK